MLRNSVHELATNGHRANKGKVFTIEIPSDALFTLTAILKKIALDSTNYVDVANAVQCHELIWEQAKEQGF